MLVSVNRASLLLLKTRRGLFESFLHTHGNELEVMEGLWEPGDPLAGTSFTGPGSVGPVSSLKQDNQLLVATETIHSLCKATSALLYFPRLMR